MPLGVAKLVGNRVFAKSFVYLNKEEKWVDLTFIDLAVYLIIVNFRTMKKALIVFVLFVISTHIKSQDLPAWKITDVEKLIQQKNEGVLVINFWATFCRPCVAEIPSFIKISDQYKNDSVTLYLVSVDLPSAYPKKISTFARDKQFNSNISWLNETNADYFCPKVDESWSGSIPATLFVNTKTGYRKFYEGEMKASAFEAELQKAIGNNK